MSEYSLFSPSRILDMASVDRFLVAVIIFSVLSLLSLLAGEVVVVLIVLERKKRKREGVLNLIYSDSQMNQPE